MTSTVDNRNELKQPKSVAALSDRTGLATPDAKDPVATTTQQTPTSRIKQPRRVLERSAWQQQYARQLIVTDVLVIAGAAILAHHLRFGGAPHPSGEPGIGPLGNSTLLVAVWLICLGLFRTRCPKFIGSGLEEYRRVMGACFWTFWLLAVLELILKLQFSRGYLALALPAGLVGLMLSRWLWRKHLSHRHVGGSYQTAVLVIGEGSAVENLSSELTATPASGYEVVGVCIAGYGAARGEYLTVNDHKIPILGGETSALEAIGACDADTVAIAETGHLGMQGIRRLIWKLDPMGVDLLVSPGVMDIAPSRMVMRQVAGLPLLHIEKPQYRGAKRIEKRVFDISFAVLILTVASPVLIAIAIAIKATSRGPVLYGSERIGIDGRPFRMLKFRTMVADAEQQLASLVLKNDSDGLLFKIRDDPRVTPIGRILRRLSLDELPQFINVLRREMSVVGPRPPLRREVEGYDRDIERRLLVRPGITGLWQVSGRSDLSWDRAVRLDLSYVDNWSMSGDLAIITKTLSAVVQQRGAY
jgi:exopolysaccharide biosynthesis polyprenyl glycosylphosphotransferase